MGKIGTNLHRFFPPKDLVYFWLIIRSHFKAQTFFPPKDLVYFLVFTWLLLKAQNFPVKRLRIFLSKPKLDFKSNFSCQTTMIIFLRWKSNSKHRLFFSCQNYFFCCYLQSTRINDQIWFYCLLLNLRRQAFEDNTNMASSVNMK